MSARYGRLEWNSRNKNQIRCIVLESRECTIDCTYRSGYVRQCADIPRWLAVQMGELWLIRSAQNIEYHIKLTLSLGVKTLIFLFTFWSGTQLPTTVRTDTSIRTAVRSKLRKFNLTRLWKCDVRGVECRFLSTIFNYVMSKELLYKMIFKQRSKQ